MKTILLGVSGLIMTIIISQVVYQKTSANEMTPLDLVSDYQKFTVSVSLDKNEGRSFTYHYEYKEEE